MVRGPTTAEADAPDDVVGRLRRVVPPAEPLGFPVEGTWQADSGSWGQKGPIRGRFACRVA